MTSKRLATAADVPPTSCCICLAPLVHSPGWEADGHLVCEDCCQRTLSLIQTADTASLAEVWFVGRALFDVRLDRFSASGRTAQRHADLALTYSDLRLDVDARVAALIAARRGDATIWRQLIGVLLGQRLAMPAFKDALRRALADVSRD